MKKDWKYYLGLGLFAYSFLPLAVLAVLPFWGLTLEESGAFALAFLATGEIAFYGAAVLLGKEFLAAMKKRIAGWFRRAAGPPKPVGRARHRAGVILFAASFLPYYAVMVDLLFFAPQGAVITFLAWALVVGELMGMAGLFLLGGQFWERLKHLFDWPGAPPAVDFPPPAG